VVTELFHKTNRVQVSIKELNGTFFFKDYEIELVKEQITSPVFKKGDHVVVRSEIAGGSMLVHAIVSQDYLGEKWVVVSISGETFLFAPHELKPFPLKDYLKTVDEAPEELKKPPIGIIPERLWRKSRVSDLVEAIERYSAASLPANLEWAQELKSHLEYLNTTKP
jgi:hypothetical protein